jgi:ferrous iron transport protein A
MTLLDLSKGQSARIVDLPPGNMARHRLLDLLILPGTDIKVMRRDFTGPVIIKVHSSRVAIGRGLASQIIVEKMEAEG